jgi:hypothetical protein
MNTGKSRGWKHYLSKPDKKGIKQTQAARIMENQLSRKELPQSPRNFKHLQHSAFVELIVNLIWYSPDDTP